MSIKQFQRLVEEYIELGCDSETIVEMILNLGPFVIQRKKDVCRPGNF